MTHREKRNWSQYNEKLKKIARIDFYISEEAIENWHYKGRQKHGGKIIYSDIVIELCLLIREFYQLPYRQTQGFVNSALNLMKLDLQVPDYTTLCRRTPQLSVSLHHKARFAGAREGMVVAVDSTGLSLYTHSEWNRKKHQNNRVPGYEKWRKLHVIIDVKTGEILENKYTKSTQNDGPEFSALLDAIDAPIQAVCGDMAYDTLKVRKAIYERNARQLIPPIRKARVAKNNRNIPKSCHPILQERDEAIQYIQHNTINGDASLARQSWKEKSGYHARSLVETTMWQIKSHTSDSLSNKREDTRATQARIKCKIVNLVNAA